MKKNKRQILQEWNGLLESGIITKDEFNRKKQELLEDTITNDEILSASDRQYFGTQKGTISVDNQINKNYLIIGVLFVVLLFVSFLFYKKISTENTQTIHTQQEENTRENKYLYISNNINLSKEYLRDDQLKYLDKTELLILRNEIFARHGYIFKREDLKGYFNQFDWYYPRFNDVSHLLNEVELYNIEKIKQYE